MIVLALLISLLAFAVVCSGRRDYREDVLDIEWGPDYRHLSPAKKEELRSQFQQRKHESQRDKLNHHGWDDAHHRQLQGPPALFPVPTPQPTNTITSNPSTQPTISGSTNPPSTQPIASPPTSSQPSSAPLLPPSLAPFGVGPPAAFPAPTVQPSGAPVPTNPTPTPTTQPIILPVSSSKAPSDTPTPYPTITSYPTAEGTPAVAAPSEIPTGPGGFLHLPSFSPVPTPPPVVAAAAVRLPAPKHALEIVAAEMEADARADALP